MPMSFLTRFIQEAPFQFEIAALIQTILMGRPCMGYSHSGPTPGSVVDYELTSPLVFGEPEGQGLNYRIPFESRGVACGQCKTTEGADYTFARDSDIRGEVEVLFPSDTLALEAPKKILARVGLSLMIDNVQTDDVQSPASVSTTFAGES